MGELPLELAERGPTSEADVFIVTHTCCIAGDRSLFICLRLTDRIG